MSYVAHPSQETRSEAQQACPITPMVLDIQAIQALYGANLTTRVGNTTYFGPAAPGSNETAYALLDGGRLPNGIAAILTIWDSRGIDTINASNQTQAVRINLNPGQFSKIGPFDNNVGLAAPVTVGGVIVNLIENATGGRGNDVLTGNVGANVLTGGHGNDTLNGGRGNDTLGGGVGRDTLTGSVGEDAFLFNAPLSATTNVDRIVDFTLDQDIIELTGRFFSALGAPGAVAANEFVVGTAALTATQHIIYNDVNGSLSYDSDGSGPRGAIQFAILRPDLNLNNTDFLVV